MSTRHEDRVKAYRYILELTGRLNTKPGLVTGQGLIDAGYVSLSELIKLKDGTGDPSPEMVTVLRGIFGGIAPGAEIDAHLVTPFRVH